MTEMVRCQLEAVQRALSEEPVIVRYDAERHVGIVLVARLTETDVEYVPLAEVLLVFPSPVEDFQ